MRLFLLFSFIICFILKSNAQTDDLALVRFTSPLTISCDNSDSVEVSVIVKNEGTITRTDFDLTYRVNCFIISTETFNSSLPPGGVTIYTFNKKVYITAAGA